MAFFEGYQYDLFISYSHDDNHRLLGEDKGWVTALHSYLEQRLNTSFAKPFTIWRDEQRMSVGDKLDATLAAGVTNSALLLSVFSPRYMRSFWCKQELCNFYQNAERHDGLRAANQTRIIKVIKSPIKPEHYPPELPPAVGDELLGFNLYRVDEEKKMELPYHTARDVDEFTERCEYLVQEIKRLIEKLADATAPAPEVDNPLPPSGPNAVALPRIEVVHDPALVAKTIYLAETSSDFNVLRENLKCQLCEDQFIVLPEQEYSRTAKAPELEAQIRGLLQRARLSIHLIGSDYAFAPEKSGGRSIEQMQYELAAERCADPNFARIVWLPPQPQNVEPRQADFIKYLRADAGTQPQDELLDKQLFEELKTFVRDQLKPPTVTPSDNGTPTSVYLICDRKDYGNTDPLYTYLNEREVVVFRADPECSDVEFRESHDENLKSCDAVLIYYGLAKGDWVMRTGLEVDRFAFNRKVPFRAKAFYLDRPPSTPKTSFKYPKALVIRTYDQVDPAELGEFLQRLKLM